MKKRLFQPIWKFEEIEKQLTALEESGWRLNKIRGLRCFEFVESKPKTVQYFLTYSITFHSMFAPKNNSFNPFDQKSSAKGIKKALTSALIKANAILR